LALPREIGTHPETEKPITAGIGRFGPYVENDKKYASLPEGEDVLTIGLNRAIDLLATAKTRGRGPGALREIGAHPEDGKPVTLHSGRYGPYIKHGRTNATLPKDKDPETVDLGEAVALIAAKIAKGPAQKPARGRAKTAKTTKAKKPAKATKAKKPTKAKKTAPGSRKAKAASPRADAASDA
jgi:DNA topoisomerase-1